MQGRRCEGGRGSQNPARRGGAAGAEEAARLRRGQQQWLTPLARNPRSPRRYALLQGVGALDHAVVPFDLPRQIVDLDLHCRAGRELNTSPLDKGEHPSCHERRDSRFHMSLFS